MKKTSRRAGKLVAKTKLDMSAQADFDEVVRLIDAARTRGVSAVNTTLIELYWNVGQYISHKIESAAWGEGVVDQLTEHIALIQLYEALPAATCFECGSSTKHTGTTKKCHRW